MPASAGIEPQKLADIRAYGGVFLRRAMSAFGGKRTLPIGQAWVSSTTVSRLASTRTCHIDQAFNVFVVGQDRI
jgi:hypothetical protein